MTTTPTNEIIDDLAGICQALKEMNVGLSVPLERVDLAVDEMRRLAARVVELEGQNGLLMVAHQALFDHYEAGDCSRCMGGEMDDEDDDEDDTEIDGRLYEPLPGQTSFLDMGDDE